MYNELHRWSRKGKLGEIGTWGALYDIDSLCPNGFTPLHYAAMSDFPNTAKTLLKLGASVSLVGDGGATALLICVQRGHLGVAKVLIRAQADLEAASATKDSLGDRPLHFAIRCGHMAVMTELIEAGANVNSHGKGGYTPMIMAAKLGNRRAVRALVYAGADPLVSAEPTTKQTIIPCSAIYPLDAAASAGESCVVRELLHLCGICGCVGESGGANALAWAAAQGYLETLAVLTSKGVVDDGVAIGAAVDVGQGEAVNFLLQSHQGKIVQGRPYVDSIDAKGLTPLLKCIKRRAGFGGSKIAQILIVYGADTTSHQLDGRTTPLEAIDLISSSSNKSVTEMRRQRLAGIRRLLLQAEAIRALSWAWPVELEVPWTWPGELVVPWVRSCTAKAADCRVAPRLGKTTASPRRMLPVMRRVANRPKMLLAARIR